MKTIENFAELEIPACIKTALTDMGFSAPTPIQAQSIPSALTGKDVIGTAQTGTGKTAAFGIPLISSLYGKPGKCGLILAPTRELAQQIHKVLKQISKGSNVRGALVVGGESFNRQINEMARDCDYIVATPGRLNDHLMEGTVDLAQVAVLVLDEVDRMLDMGFLPQIEAILKTVPKERQTLLFSATIPKEVARLMDRLVNSPVRISVGDTIKPNASIKQEMRIVSLGDKMKVLMEELGKREGKVLVFVQTKHRTEKLERIFRNKGIDAVTLHGGKTQGQRKKSLELFRRGSHRVMLATDLAGRGLDIVDIDHVINYDVPMTREDYIHRIGRTARGASGTGSAVSFVVEGNYQEQEVVTGERVKPQKQGRSASQGRFRTDMAQEAEREGDFRAPREQGGGNPFGKKRFPGSKRFEKRSFEKTRDFKNARTPFRQHQENPAFRTPEFQETYEERPKRPFMRGGAGGGKPFGKPFGQRGGGKQFGRPRFEKPGFDRGERPQFGKPRFENSDRPARSFDKPRFDRSERPAFANRGERPSFGDRGGDRPQFDRGGKPPFQRRRPGGFQQKPRFEHAKFGDRPRFEGERPAFGRQERRDPFTKPNSVYRADSFGGPKFNDNRPKFRKPGTDKLARKGRLGFLDQMTQPPRKPRFKDEADAVIREF